ncbi:MAG: glycine cleavage system aminomethyltransferase GcvT [Rhodobacteraceae bacterium]|jgi:aminomethyltransferase|nr:glycine cleavage system aminomethyltransferase GcvT [Paracoccaceae bacterium]
MAGPRELPLKALHGRLGARMVPFAGWEMPVQYAPGVLREHLHTRAAAGLFDVSHMGQVLLRTASGQATDAARALEALVPADLVSLPEGRQRYAVFTNAAGGIEDDLMVANRGDHLFLIVNAARVEADLALLRAGLAGVGVTPVADRALLAIQGPAAEAALAALVPAAAAMRFMDVARPAWQGAELWVSRSGYTGEDGFEVSVPLSHAEALAEALLARPGVAPIGLGARDSLRLEAGLPLYGHDLDAATSPVEAGLDWSVGRARRDGGARTGGFPGAPRILAELAEGPVRRRVGLLPEGRAPMREGVAIFPDAEGGEAVGTVTSGGFAPSLDRPVAMGYVAAAFAAPGQTLWGELRGRRLPVTVTPLPFRPSTYKR